MKRDILLIKRDRHISGCCPGHDSYPNSRYRNKRSQKARSKGKKLEHRAFRRIMKQENRNVLYI